MYFLKRKCFFFVEKSEGEIETILLLLLLLFIIVLVVVVVLDDLIFMHTNGLLEVEKTTTTIINASYSKETRNALQKVICLFKHWQLLLLLLFIKIIYFKHGITGVRNFSKCNSRE